MNWDLKYFYPELFPYRDGQLVAGEAYGGCITNLHHPRDWHILEQQLHTSFQSGVGGKVYYAIGCHPKKASLLSSPSLLKRLELLVRKPSVVALGECGLDYSARLLNFSLDLFGYYCITITILLITSSSFS